LATCSARKMWVIESRWRPRLSVRLQILYPCIESYLRGRAGPQKIVGLKKSRGEVTSRVSGQTKSQPSDRFVSSNVSIREKVSSRASNLSTPAPYRRLSTPGSVAWALAGTRGKAILISMTLHIVYKRQEVYCPLNPVWVV